MTDLLIDQILADTQEPEPFDDAFVRIVMADVISEEQRRWRLRLVRRPVVFGVAAVVLATSGAVAALVGTHITPKTTAASSSPRSAHVTVSTGPAASAAGSRVAVPSASSVASPVASAASPIAGIHWGFPTTHTAWVVDDQTGLKLTTETMTNTFTVGKAQQVTLTLLNTSKDPIAVSGFNGCALEVVATPSGGKSLAPSCASGGVSDDRVLLAPGGFYTAHADVKLPSAGTWTIAATCRCAYTQPTKAQAPTKSNDPFGSLLQKAAPPPILPQKNGPQSGVARLTTPAITVKASS